MESRVGKLTGHLAFAYSFGIISLSSIIFTYAFLELTFLHAGVCIIFSGLLGLVIGAFSE